MNPGTARRRKWAIKLFMSKSLESHHTIVLDTLSKHIKAEKLKLKEGTELRRPVTPLLPWVIDVALKDFTDAFGKLGVDLIRMDIKELR